jgi:RNA polymerase sigma-70 factor (ECF subfamily)
LKKILFFYERNLSCHSNELKDNYYIICFGVHNLSFKKHTTVLSYQLYTDKELATLLKTADEDAYVELIYRYEKILFRCAYIICQNKEMSEDAVQNVWLYLWERHNEVTILNIQSYLKKAIKFEVIKQINQSKKRQAGLKRKIMLEAPSDGDEKMKADFLQMIINNSVEKMPTKCRQVFVYSREMGMSISQIARKMDISHKTVEAHLSKALKMLSHAIQSTWVLFFFMLTSILLWRHIPTFRHCFRLGWVFQHHAAAIHHFAKLCCRSVVISFRGSSSFFKAK